MARFKVLKTCCSGFSWAARLTLDKCWVSTQVFYTVTHRGVDETPITSGHGRIAQTETPVNSRCDRPRKNRQLSHPDASCVPDSRQQRGDGGPALAVEQNRALVLVHLWEVRGTTALVLNHMGFSVPPGVLWRTGRGYSEQSQFFNPF